MARSSRHPARFVLVNTNQKDAFRNQPVQGCTAKEERHRVPKWKLQPIRRPLLAFRIGYTQTFGPKIVSKLTVSHSNLEI